MPAIDADWWKKFVVSSLSFQLRLKGYDVVSAHDVQRQSLSDYQQLEYAVSEGRAIVTFNSGDFDRIHKEYIKRGKNHFGILLSKQIPVGELTRRIAKFLFSHTSGEMKTTIFWL